MLAQIQGKQDSRKGRNLSVIIDDEDRAVLKVIGALDGISLSDVVRRAIKREIARHMQVAA